MQYLIFPTGEQRAFLREAKAQLGVTWNRMVGMLGVNRSMVYFYVNEHSKLPLQHYESLCELTDSLPKSIPMTEISNKPKEIQLPALSEKFAEFLGILAGDGHLDATKYVISVTLDKDRDADFSLYVGQLIEQLFCLRPSYYYQGNAVRCYFSSREIVNHLVVVYGFPRGKKKHRLRIPDVLWKKPVHLAAFLRGVFDTDGCFHRHRKRDAVIEFSSRDQSFLRDIYNALKTLGFRASLSTKSAYIYAKKDIARFFEIIRPANAKHLRKYLHYREHGYVPKCDELIR